MRSSKHRPRVTNYSSPDPHAHDGSINRLTHTRLPFCGLTTIMLNTEDVRPMSCLITNKTPHVSTCFQMNGYMPFISGAVEWPWLVPRNIRTHTCVCVHVRVWRQRNIFSSHVKTAQRQEVSSTQNEVTVAEGEKAFN